LIIRKSYAGGLYIVKIVFHACFFSDVNHELL
jgi:hypothetical protein